MRLQIGTTYLMPPSSGQQHDVQGSIGPAHVVALTGWYACAAER